MWGLTVGDYNRQLEGSKKRHARTITEFAGCHFGTGRTDQPNAFSYGADFDFKDRKAYLRDGKRKNQDLGYPTSIDSVFYHTISGRRMMGQVTNGTLQLYLADDVLDRVRRYWTVDEVASTFTVDTLKAKTVNDLITGQ
jgi:hypothetical protein